MNNIVDLTAERVRREAAETIGPVRPMASRFEQTIERLLAAYEILNRRQQTGTTDETRSI